MLEIRNRSETAKGELTKIRIVFSGCKLFTFSPSSIAAGKLSTRYHPRYPNFHEIHHQISKSSSRFMKINKLRFDRYSIFITPATKKNFKADLS